MRRIPAASLCALLLLTGCGRAALPAPAETPAQSATVTMVEDLASLPELDSAGSAAMANFMTGNRALVQDDTLYTLDYDESLQPVLARYRLTERGPEDRAILAENCVAEYLCGSGEMLYFLNAGRLEQIDPDDGVRKVLAEGPYRSLQLFEESLYVLDDTGAYSRLNLAGGAEKRLLPGPCDYAYVLGDGILYQDETDRSLHLCRADGSGDRLLVAGPAYAPVWLDGVLYYSGDGCFCRYVAASNEDRSYDLPGLRGAAELFPRGEGWCARVALAGGGTEQGFLTLGDSPAYSPCEYQGYRLCDFVSGQARVDAVYEADGRLRCFALYTAAGEYRYFGGSVLP